MDRISNLPDEVLSYLISFLPTKYAVRTGVLSKRWKYVWTYITDLDISTDDSSQLLDPRFVDFVDNVIRRCNPSRIRKFRLHSSLEFDARCTAEWFREVIKRRVEELDISLEYLEVPPSFFRLDTLKLLKLKIRVGSQFPPIPDSFCFPHLKSLYLGIHSTTSDLTRKLFRSCPILEDLHIAAGWGVSLKESTFVIASLALKRLTLDLYDHNGIEPIDEIFIDAPNLKYFHLTDELLGEYSIKGSLLHAEARIDFLSCCEDECSKEEVDRAYRLLRGIKGVKSLVLEENATDALSFVLDNSMPTFHYLTRLEVKIPRLCGWTLLSCLLESSPKLEVLTVAKECYHYHVDSIPYIPESLREEQDEYFRSLPRFEEDFEWNEPRRVPDCLLSRLEVVTVIGFTWRVSEFHFLRYLLGNAEVLKKLIIIKVLILDLESELKLCKTLLDFPRASRSCVIQFYSK